VLKFVLLLKKKWKKPKKELLAYIIAKRKENNTESRPKSVLLKMDVFFVKAKKSTTET